MKSTEGVETPVPIYEDLLSRDRRWAMSQNVGPVEN
jgi:hypothetical protein